MTTRSAPVRQQSEEAYPLADLALSSSSLSRTSMDVNDTRHAAFDQRAAATRRMPAEDFGEEDVDAFIAENQGSRHGPGEGRDKHPRLRLAASFFLFGVLNNILYVIILSAALDLVPATTPKGLVAFFNIFPSLITKLLWPYLVPGAVQYKRRILVCTAASWVGMITISTCNSTALRLLGIGIASFSSGFGEMTFLQLTTTLPTPLLSRDAIGAWSSGTGGAGIGGAGLWWILRVLGVKRGLAIASFLPFAFPVVFFFLLPAFDRLGGHAALEHGEDDDYTGATVSHYSVPGQPIFAVDDDDDDDDDLSVHTARKVTSPAVPLRETVLSTQEKVELAKPLLVKYMLPLFLVYAFEYIINTGVAPTLAFPPPSSGIWSKVFKSIRDYYPFWSLTYQTFVFISRSFLSLGLPPLPKRLLFLPAACQAVILTLLSLQASHYIFSSSDARPHQHQSSHDADSVSWWSWVIGWLHNTSSTSTTGSAGATKHVTDRAISVVFLLVCLEGLMGGTGYCMTYYHIGREGDEQGREDGHHHAVNEYERVAAGAHAEFTSGESHSAAEQRTKRKARKEFRIAAAGAADSLGIVFASLISMPVEVSLCNAQVKAGSSLCKEL